MEHLSMTWKEAVASLIYSRQNLKANFHGTKISILCPFHKDSFPQLVIDYERQNFCCLGCNQRGELDALLAHLGDANFDATVLLPPMDNALAELNEVTHYNEEKNAMSMHADDFENPVQQAPMRPIFEDNPINAKARASIAARKKRR